MYNYYSEMKDDILNAIEENYTADELECKMMDRERFYEKLCDELWIDDSVTGNASGSYWCNSYRAQECLWGNEELLVEALDEFGGGAEAYREAITSPEWADVSIRCYLLGQCIALALDELD